MLCRLRRCSHPRNGQNKFKGLHGSNRAKAEEVAEVQEGEEEKQAFSWHTCKRTAQNVNSPTGPSPASPVVAALHDFILLCFRQDFTRASTGLSDKTSDVQFHRFPQISTVPTSGVPLSQRLRQRLATTIAEQEKQVEAKRQSGKVIRCYQVVKWVKSSSESTARLCLVVLCQAVPTEAQKQIVRSSRSCTCRQLDPCISWCGPESKTCQPHAKKKCDIWYLDRRCRFKGWDLGSRRSWSQWSRSNCPAPKLWLGPMRVNAVNICELWMVQVLLTFFFSCLHVSLGATVDFTCQKSCCLFSDRLVCWVLPRLEHWATAFGPSLKEQLRLGKVVADAMCHVGHFGCTRNRRVVWDC